MTSEKAKRFMRKLPENQPPTFAKQFSGTPRDALDVLRNMLQIHPKKRITTTDCLAHPFFGQLHSPDDEPIAQSAFDFSFEKDKLNRLRLKELIWAEVGDFRPSCMPIAPRKDKTGMHEA